MLSASQLADRLARTAETVCRHYLSAGRRLGNYWIVGDVANNSGRSLYVHLAGPRAGRWTDSATGQHGDLLDLVRETCSLNDFRSLADEVRRFLSLPHPPLVDADRLPSRGGDGNDHSSAAASAVDRARRLFRMTQPLAGTVADGYLRGRAIPHATLHPALRFHPCCYYRDLATGLTSSFPAMIAAVTDEVGVITGVHRTYLDSAALNPRSIGKARVDTPRRALGRLLGNAVRFHFPLRGPVPVMVAGEGIESILSLSEVMPAIPMVAALSANHLAAFRLPSGCRRLYIATDADAAGRHGVEGLSRRAQALQILPLVLAPQLGDFNEDLRRLGPDRLITNLRSQLAPDDAPVFFSS